MSADRSRPDLLLVTLIHQSLRIDVARLSAAVTALETAGRFRRLPGIRAVFNEYCGQLRLHHSHEDHLFFPGLQAAVGADAVPLSDLAIQHETIDAELQAISDGFASLADPTDSFGVHRAKVVDDLSGLETHLGAHLDLEEATVFPLIELAFSPTEYKHLEAQARRQTPRSRAQFLVPWLVAHATPQQQTALFKAAPPLRAIYWLNRRRYRHLDQALV